MSACNEGDLGSIPGSGRSPGEGNANSLQYPMDGGAWWTTVHEVAKSWTRLSDFTSLSKNRLHHTQASAMLCSCRLSIKPVELNRSKRYSPSTG